MTLADVVDDLNRNPHRRRSFYDYPALYDFYHSRALDRDAQVRLLKRFQPSETRRVLEFGCGTGPLLARIEGEYEAVLGVDSNEAMLDAAAERITEASVRRADFTEWSAGDIDRVFDVAALMGGLLHVTEDRALESFAENVYGSLRPGGGFVTFYQPLSESVDNGSREVQTVESERYRVVRHSVTALTSPSGNYTTTYLFVVHDKDRDIRARMGTVFRGRFHDPGALEDAFLAAGFDEAETVDGDGPAVFHAVK